MSHKKQDFNKEQDFFYDVFEELANGWCPSKPLNIELAEIEKQRVESALAEHDNNRTKAAEHLGIGRTLLIHKIKKYDLI
jgi:transcriptional regulator with PAS, ATPase and Fis domain